MFVAILAAQSGLRQRQLKEAARCWNWKFDAFLNSSGYKQMISNPCPYLFRCDLGFEILMVYVDDLIVLPDQIDLIQKEKTKLSRKFAMTDQNKLTFILGNSVKCNRENKII